MTLNMYTFVLQIFFFLTSYAIPLAIICILYVLMLMRLWKGVNPGGQPPSAESRRGKKRVTRMVVVVVAIFAFCWFPIQVSGNHFFIIVIIAIVKNTHTQNKFACSALRLFRFVVVGNKKC